MKPRGISQRDEEEGVEAERLERSILLNGVPARAWVAPRQVAGGVGRGVSFLSAWLASCRLSKKERSEEAFFVWIRSLKKGGMGEVAETPERR